MPMNPREWTDHYDCTVQVGLGTGNQDQRLQVLQQVLNVQEKNDWYGWYGYGYSTNNLQYNRSILAK